jgi:hypothetical protein
MLIGRAGRGQEQDVAARSAARQAARFWENLGWALAYVLGACGDNRYRIGNGLDFDRRQGRFDGRRFERWLSESDSLPSTLAMASGLFSATFLALDGSSVGLTGMPGPPALGGFLTSRAAITSLRPRWQEPAFAVFKEAPATARVPTAKVVPLTRHQRAGTLNTAHGRACSRAVRRREGGTSRRYLAPTTWTPLVQTPPADTC